MTLSLIERRKIEAGIVVPLIKGYAEALGIDKSISVATAVIQQLARDAGRQIAEDRGADTLTEFADVVRTLWSRGGKTLEIEFMETSDTVLTFNVKRCLYAEQYEKLGIGGYGYCLSCSRDAAFAEGFNPKIKMTRTQTVMEGAPHCDFRFCIDR